MINITTVFLSLSYVVPRRKKREQATLNLNIKKYLFFGGVGGKTETVDDVKKFTEIIYMLGNNFAQGN